MIRVGFERTISLVLTALIGLNAVLVTTTVMEKRRLASAHLHYDGLGELQFEGLDRDGRRTINAADGEMGLVVRYASTACVFSTRDEQWNTVLSPKLQERGIPIVILAPNARTISTPGELLPMDAPELTYVSPDWIRRYSLTLTPTLLIFDGRGRLIWHREGTLSAADTETALHAVDTAIGQR